MLGQIMRSNIPWSWAAYGKHPGAKDFIRIGEPFPLMNSFQEWVERGHGVITTKNATQEHRSWRFWARGLQKDSAVCGLVKDSRDALGRSFPLLIMGTGTLRDWEKEWDLMPYVSENAWSRMEFLATHELSQLNEGIQSIKPLNPDWQRFERVREQFKRASRGFFGSADVAEGVRDAGAGKSIVDLLAAPCHAQSDPVGSWHHYFRSAADATPNAVFIGGTMTNTYMAVFRKSLAPEDFVQLWTANG